MWEAVLKDKAPLTALVDRLCHSSREDDRHIPPSQGNEIIINYKNEQQTFRIFAVLTYWYTLTVLL